LGHRKGEQKRSLKICTAWVTYVKRTLGGTSVSKKKEGRGLHISISPKKEKASGRESLRRPNRDFVVKKEHGKEASPDGRRWREMIEKGRKAPL